MGWSSFRYLVGLFIVLNLMLTLRCNNEFPDVIRVSGDLDHEIYVWQRSWTGSVQDSLIEAQSRFSRIVVLGAEVSFAGGELEVMRVPIDYESLADSGLSVGAALRIGSYGGPFSEDDVTSRMLADIAWDLVSDASDHGIAISEIQIDFDAAESKLDGYRQWLNAVRKRIDPVPLTITALPTWMNSQSFSSLVQATDGFVLQVHSLEPPEDINSDFTLCDPSRSKSWIERAAQLCGSEINFRVALPTYGYTVAFSSDGEFTGLSAEGAYPNWPEGTRTREVLSDPIELAELVKDLTLDRPENMAGLIWYRMPVSGDRLNWPWPTLEAVMDGRVPNRSLTVKEEKPESGLFDIYLVNNGETSEVPDVKFSITWTDADLLAFDLLRDFMITDQGPGTVTLQGPSTESALHPVRIGPGESWMVSWLRFDRDTNVQIDVSRITH